GDGSQTSAMAARSRPKLLPPEVKRIRFLSSFRQSGARWEATVCLGPIMVAIVRDLQTVPTDWPGSELPARTCWSASTGTELGIHRIGIALDILAATSVRLPFHVRKQDLQAESATSASNVPLARRTRARRKLGPGRLQWMARREPVT